jgi:hypothetical protein
MVLGSSLMRGAKHKALEVKKDPMGLFLFSGEVVPHRKTERLSDPSTRPSWICLVGRGLAIWTFGGDVTVFVKVFDTVPPTAVINVADNLSVSIPGPKCNVLSATRAYCVIACFDETKDCSGSKKCSRHFVSLESEMESYDRDYTG